MKKRLIAMAVLAVLICGMCASALAATYGTVVGGWLRLRANPSYSATVIASYKTGSVVTVLSQEYGWARVLTADYRLGYMDQRYLIIGSAPAPDPAPAPAPKPSRTWTDVNRIAYVTSQNGKGVRLRSAPVVNSGNVMGLYPVGRTVTEIRRSSDGWSYIRIDKKYGYMMSQFLVSSSPIPDPTPKPKPGPDPTGKPTEMPTITPTPSPTPTPDPMIITSAKLDPIKPTVGDTIRVIVTPSGADYTVVWYNDENVLLATGKTYKVHTADLGHVINVRIMGAGESAGFVADVATAKVEPAP